MEATVLFSKELIDSLRADPPKYYLGTDSGVGIYSYCLAQRFPDGKMQILLCKNFSDEIEWSREVYNLQKYFNATVYK